MNIVIIPSYNPNDKLIKVVKDLKQVNLNNLVVVDDGSASKTIFKKLEKECIVVHHNINMGKGAAIKTGVRKAIKEYKNINGFIFVDGDGQHLAKDVKKINDELNKNDEIILGVRDFNDPNVPSRSKFGNKASRLYFKLATGKTLSDTQTGLRGIPYKYENYLLYTEGNRYEYEMNFLLNTANDGIPFKTINITTVYEENNKESHFNPIKDSIRIYAEPLKYIVSSLSSFIIDVLLFSLFNKISGLVFFANILARFISGTYNYCVNKYWCFKSYGKHELPKYLLLFFTQMLISSGLLKLFSLLDNHFIILKIIIDFIIFVVNYLIQKRYIFKEKVFEKKL
jgi:putative flippase GtrA